MKSFFKKIAKGIKTGLKSVGKAFKKVFKGIGKFVGKLGPIGMLGMMLLMPQLGAWWGQFGTWAGTQAGALGSVMKGIHAVGATVGSAYNTVTGGIQKTLNVATGGTFSAAGAAGYEAGYSDQLASWLGGKADSAREFLGLETQQGLQASQAARAREALKLPEGLSDLPEGWTVTKDSKFLRTPTGEFRVIGSPAASVDLKISAAQQSITSQEFSNLINTESGLVQAEEYKYILDDTLGKNEYVLNARYKNAPTTIKQPSAIDTSKVIDAGAAAKESSTLSKIGKVATTAGSVLTVAQQLAGDSYYDDDAAYSGYVAENMLPMYESANVDWLQQGLAGAPYFGAGNAGYFQSVVNAEQIDPWYAYMRNV